MGSIAIWPAYKGGGKTGEWEGRWEKIEISVMEVGEQSFGLIFGDSKCTSNSLIVCFT